MSDQPSTPAQISPTGSTMPPASAPLTRPEGHAGQEDREERFLRRHATGITLISVLVGGAVLGAAPVPAWLKPVNLSTPEDVRLVAESITHKPNMTFTRLQVEPDAPPEEEEAAIEVAIAPEQAVPVVIDEPMLTAIAPIKAPAESSTDVSKRHLKPSTKSALHFQQQARSLLAPGAPIDNPCIKQGPKGCLETALDPFFVALDAVAAKEDGAHVNVITLGNSLIASDHVTDIVRRRLAQNFGDGGRGFILPDRLSKMAGRRVRTGHASASWRINTFAQRPPKRTQFGFSGSHHESTRKGDKIRWSLHGAEHARLFWLDHRKRPSFRLEVDGNVIKRFPRGKYLGPKKGQDMLTDVEIPAGSKRLTLVSSGAGTVIYGVALTKSTPGVSWDTIGVPAAGASMYVEKTDSGIFTRQLKARDPALMVFMLGGNETRSLAFGWKTETQLHDALSTLVERSMSALPNGSCLVVSPIDSVKATAAGARLTTRSELFKIVGMEHQVAQEKGCAFFNLFAAMGGKGSFQRFHRKGLVNADFVHPTGAGGNVLGQLFADALLQSYLQTPTPKIKRLRKTHIKKPQLLGLTFPNHNDGAFEQTFSALSKLEAGDVVGAEARRVAVGLFGGSLLSDHVLPSRMRERMTQRFGTAGYGFVPAGGRDRGLLAGRVTRRLSGKTHVSDGRRVVLGGAMSMAGRSLRLQEGAQFDLAFCDGCQENDNAPAGSLDVAWLYTPGMGKADLYVNDVWVGVIGPGARRNRQSDVQFLQVPVRGESHQLSVRVRAPPDEKELERRRQRRSKHRITKSDTGPFGPVTLLSVTGEVERSGVVVDDVGIAGTTGMTMQRWRQDLLSEQVTARDYDLVVLMWGTYEARLKKLDAVTYRHHLNGTLRTLTTRRDSERNAPDCLIVGPTDQLVAHRQKGVKDEKAALPTLAPKSYDMVVGVQKELAAKYGCAFFDAQKAMGGPGSIARWSKKGFAKKDRLHLTPKGSRAFADGVFQDLMAWYAYRNAKHDEEKREAVAANKTVARATFTLEALDLSGVGKNVRDNLAVANQVINDDKKANSSPYQVDETSKTTNTPPNKGANR